MDDSSFRSDPHRGGWMTEAVTHALTGFAITVVLGIVGLLFLLGFAFWEVVK